MKVLLHKNKNLLNGIYRHYSTCKLKKYFVSLAVSSIVNNKISNQSLEFENNINNSAKVKDKFQGKLYLQLIQLKCLKSLI